MKWKIVNCNEGRISLIDYDEEHECYWHHIELKFDGTVYMHVAGNDPYCKEDGFHDTQRSPKACDSFLQFDFDNMVETLKQLEPIAAEYFKERWEKLGRWS